MKVLQLLLLTAFMAIVTPPLVHGKASDGEKDIIKLRGKCIVARKGKSLLNGIKSKADCLKACLDIAAAKGCQYRKRNKKCKVVMDSFEKANNRRRVTCWKFEGGEATTLIFLGPGDYTSGHSEVFSIPISENKDLTTQTCTVPQFPITDIKYSVGFVYENFLHICGGYSRSGSPSYQSACFSLINSTWSETTPMLTARSAPAAVRMQNGSVLVSGGYSGSSRLQTSELLTGSTWTPSIQLPSQRTGHCMLQLSTGEMFMHGGYSGLLAVNDTHISKDHASWEKVMSSKHKGGYHACTEVIINSDQQVWIARIRKTEICQLVDGTWTWTEGPDLPTTCNTGYNRFISNNGKMFYSCGYDKNIYQLKKNWQTNKLDAWAKIGEMSERRRYFPAMLITEDVCKGIKTPVQSAAATPPGPG